MKKVRARLNAHSQNDPTPRVQTRGQVMEASITNSFLIIISLFVLCWIVSSKLLANCKSLINYTFSREVFIT